jgi:hypothetical protein
VKKAGNQRNLEKEIVAHLVVSDNKGESQAVH